MRKYEDLPFVPSVIATQVCHCPPGSEHPHNSMLRKKFVRSRKRVKEFADAVDRKCRFACEFQPEWFTVIVDASDSEDKFRWKCWQWLEESLHLAKIIKEIKDAPTT